MVHASAGALAVSLIAFCTAEVVETVRKVYMIIS